MLYPFPLTTASNTHPMKFGITFTLKDLSANMTGVPDDWQEELDSPVTIDAIARVLRGMGHEVVKLGDGPELIDRLRQEKPDVVFNLAEGRGVARSREAWVPALLESLGIPYTASDPLTCALTLEKDYAKRLVSSAGVLVPSGMVLQPADSLPNPEAIRLTYPLLIKPAWEGSSKGVRNRCLVHRPDDLIAVIREVHQSYIQPVLIEEFIQGEELTVGLIGNGTDLECVGIMSIMPQQPKAHFIYSLEVKRDYENQVRYECPARLPPELLVKTAAAAKTAVQALGCRDLARVDFRVRGGEPYFLEINPLPGLNPDNSDLVIMTRLQGIHYDVLIRRIVTAALSRLEMNR
jgi:D-alanine-D-alanine ligase